MNKKAKDRQPKRKRRGLKIFIGSLGFLILLILGSTIFIEQGIRSAPIPISVNMGAMGSSVGTLPITALRLGPTGAPEKDFVLTAEVVKRRGLPDEWTYNGTIPGPAIRVTQGDHVHITLINHLPAATSIHWHGLEVPNAADGVAGLTQDAVPPGHSYTYDFLVKETGTYWYHSHQDTVNQEPKGLFGALIVEPKNPPHYDHDYTLVYHNAQTAPKSVPALVWERIEQTFGRLVPQAIAINNKENEALQAQPDQTVRIRIINASAGDMTGTPLQIVPIGVKYQIVSLDGHDIHAPQMLPSMILPIGQGQRYDLLFTMPPSGIVKLIDIANNETATIGQGKIALPQNIHTLPTFDLTHYGTATPDAITSSSHFDATYPLVLGEQAGFRSGSIQLVHTMNGKPSPETPMIMVHQGQMIHLHIVNQTDEYHPIHLHGHIFTILKMNGKEVTGSPIRMDSVLVGPHEMADVAFLANNPGLWMLHCHVLLHANFGMSMMVMYPNITTPYRVGSASGNFPD